MSVLIVLALAPSVEFSQRRTLVEQLVHAEKVRHTSHGVHEVITVSGSDARIGAPVFVHLAKAHVIRDVHWI